MIDLLYYLAVSIGINVLLFFPAYLFKTDKLTDFSYSFTFIVLSLFAFFSVPYAPNKLILMLMIILWALRLGIFLVARIWTVKKDRRFDAFRDSFTGFLKFWLLQGFAVWVIMIPALFYFNTETPYFSYIGFGLWLIGLIIESVADYQKFSFKLKAENKDKFIQSGLWKYSRHPNYFGEILVWIGAYLFVVLTLTPLQMAIGVLSPLFIILLLAFVSGLPQLESYADKKWGADKGYQDYKKKTSILVPWF